MTSSSVGLDRDRHVELVALGEAGQRPVEVGRERLLHRRGPGQAHPVGVGVVPVGGDRRPQRRPVEPDALQLVVDVGEEPVGLEARRAAQRRLQQPGLALGDEADELGEAAHALLADDPHPLQTVGTARGGGPDAVHPAVAGSAALPLARGGRDGLRDLGRDPDRQQQAVRLERQRPGAWTTGWGCRAGRARRTRTGRPGRRPARRPATTGRGGGSSASRCATGRSPAGSGPPGAGRPWPAGRRRPRAAGGRPPGRTRSG